MPAPGPGARHALEQPQDMPGDVAQAPAGAQMFIGVFNHPVDHLVGAGAGVGVLRAAAALVPAEIRAARPGAAEALTKR